MSRFYFDLGTPDGVAHDDSGVEFASLEEAYLGACTAALEISGEALRERRDPALWWFAIRGEAGADLLRLCFEEVLRPGAPTRTDEGAALRREIAECRRHAQKLLGDVHLQVDAARQTMHAIRTSLELLGRTAAP